MTLDYKKLRKIDGWFSRTDLEIFRALLLAQEDLFGGGGAVVEIGVHHGKSFVALAEYSGQSALYAIDVFDDQVKNIDSSGLGDKEIFLKTLAEFEVPSSRVVIDARASDEVLPEEILSSIGGVRFFHIDGAHHYQAVKSDLELAVSVLEPDGVIAVDDVFRPEWPEVSKATLGAGVLDGAGLECFAIGFNKSYFCREHVVEQYQTSLLESHFLRKFLTRVYNPMGEPVLIFQSYPLPEWGVRKFLLWALSVYRPEQYASLKPIDERSRRMVKKIRAKLTRA